MLGGVQHSIPIRLVVDEDVKDDDAAVVAAVMPVVENADDAFASSPRPCRSVPESDCPLRDSVNPILRYRLQQ